MGDLLGSRSCRYARATPEGATCRIINEEDSDGGTRHAATHLNE